MIEFISGNVAELFSALALFVSILAGSRAYSANNRAVQVAEELEREKQLARKTNLIVATEQKHAVAKRLTMVLAQKMKLLLRHPELSSSYPGEVERIRQCLSVLQEQENNLELSYELLKDGSIGKNVEHYQDSLAHIERLRVRMEGDLDNETASFEEIKDELAKQYV